ncbi:MAG TPA: molybdopterin-binding protein [Anaerolineaceae bacterium]|nr:molybdopterin-binding protein [Anaerolineaceae bacterium]
MPSAEAIIIGTELLLGETFDTNTTQIAKFFRDEGVDFYRSTIIGDNEARIIATIQEAISRSNIVITTGGIGPTVDDPTRNAVAKAMGVELIYSPDLWDQIQHRFQRYGRKPTENNKKQAYIPSNAQVIENPVGTAPAFYLPTQNGILMSLPGVPGELEFLLENQIRDILVNFYPEKYVFESLTIHTSGLGESVIDEKIADFEIMSNPTVGIVAYPGQVDVRITAKAINKEKAKSMLDEVLANLQPRLGDSIYGYNQDKFDEIIHRLLDKEKTKILLIEKGFSTPLSNHFSDNVLIQSQEKTSNLTIEVLLETNLDNLYVQYNPNILFLAHLNLKENDKSVLTLRYKDKNKEITNKFSFGGHLKFVNLWAENTALYFLRTQLIT